MAKEKKLDLSKYPKKNNLPEEPQEHKRVGRPTKYKPEFAQMLIDFFSIDPTYEEEVTYTNKKGETWSKTEKKPNFLPTFERFAHSIGVNDDTVVTWAKAKRSKGSAKYPEFSAAYTRAKQLQKDILVQNALAGRYNPAYAIFLSKNITDMRDKVEVPVDDKGNPVPFVSGFNFVRPTDNKDDGKTDNNSDN